MAERSWKYEAMPNGTLGIFDENERLLALTANHVGEKKGLGDIMRWRKMT